MTAMNLITDERATEVPRFPGYSVTTDGRVWSSKKGGRWMRLKLDKDGYVCVCLYHERKHYVHVHTLVLEAFVGPKPSGMECCHGDGDRTNNRLENLRWGTSGENYKDCVKHGTAILGKYKFAGEESGRAKLSESDVVRIRQLRDCGEKLMKLAAMYGVSYGCISSIVHRRNWRHVA